MTHKKPKIYLVSGVAVEHKGKYLILRQAEGMLDPGQWGIPGGMVEVKISIEGNAKQEVLEETGLKLDNVEFLGVIRQNFRGKVSDSDEILIYFLYHGQASTNKVKMQKEEISDHKWLSFEELKNFPKEDLRPPMDFIIKRLEEQKSFPNDVVID